MKTRLLSLIPLIIFLLPQLSVRAQGYTLLDSDVVIQNGIITECSYDFSNKHIIIPEFLQGQTVVGIVDTPINTQGPFTNKGITQIELPESMEIIGDQAFYVNPIDSLDLSTLPNLRHIGDRAFRSNSLTQLTLAGNTSLESIGADAFAGNNLTEVNLHGCSSLKEIGIQAFQYNMITEIDLSGCTSFQRIGSSAFSHNTIHQLVLTGCPGLLSIDANAFESNGLQTLDISECHQLASIGRKAFDSPDLSAFTLPSCTGYEAEGWKDETGAHYNDGALVTDHDRTYYVDHTYTLTDEDVTMVNNRIASCSYNFQFKSLAIPQTLDGQTVKGIIATEFLSGVFSRKGLIEVILPSTMEYVGDYAFELNTIYSLDLSQLTQLQYIGDQAFGIYLMGHQFDLSNHHRLEFIGIRSLGYSNDIILPVCTAWAEYGWMDSEGTAITAGTTVTNYAYYYYVPYPYTLQDEDVTMVNGVITDCHYNFVHKDIIIPSILQQQTVKGIADSGDDNRGIFYGKGLTSVQLPSTLRRIGKRAFMSNDLTELDLSHLTLLEEIGDAAFDYNALELLNMNNCASLRSIGDDAFYGHSLSNLDLSSCVNLETIGSSAFVPYWNADHSLQHVNLQGCTSLQHIERSAFAGNEIQDIDLQDCTGLTYIGQGAFINNTATGMTLPACNGYESYGWSDAQLNHFATGETVTDLDERYFVNYDYILQDEDVIIHDGILETCMYDYYFRTIIIPNVLQGQQVVQLANQTTFPNELFGGKSLVKVGFPSSMEVIGDYAMSGNDLVTLDLTACDKLLKVGEYAFSTIFSIDHLDLNGCTSLEYISDYAFFGNFFSLITMDNCHRLTYIGEGAFSENGPQGFQLPICYEFEELGWKDQYGISYMGGDSVPNYSSFWVPVSNYTLKDYDVAVTDGTITQCYYNFPIKEIIIPDQLQNQTITAVANGNINTGILASNGITHISLPNGLTSLGDYALYGNELYGIDLSQSPYLSYIGTSAFSGNLLSSLTLPDPLGFDYWVDSYGNEYTGNTTVNDLDTWYISNLMSVNTVTFVITDQSGQAVNQAMVSFNWAEMTTDVNGMVSFDQVLNGDYNYMITHEGYNSLQGTISITADTTIELVIQSLGIVKDIDKGSLIIRPNPATDHISIDGEGPAEVIILDISGRIALVVAVDDDRRIDISILKQGLYLLHVIEVGRHVRTGKLVVF